MTAVEMIFIEEHAHGRPHGKALAIPVAAPLPPVPCRWDGHRAGVGTVCSGAWRSGPSLRNFPAVFSGEITLVWVRERTEWVAFEESWETPDEYAPTWYGDSRVSLDGPWSLDDSFGHALLHAFRAPISLPAETARRTSPGEFIRLKAYSLWERRGRPVGDDWADWTGALKDLGPAVAGQAGQRWTL